ncbi:peptidylprolyl isomerase [Vampirovibrio sp.]|uniref:peptidylprolyl isomerase n=1 Tax=Vampirovibrio sp. TaxID=2717857 RepID=UPI003593A535
MQRVFSRSSQSFALMLAVSLTLSGSGLAHADLMRKMNPLNWMPGNAAESQPEANADKKALQRANEANAQADQALKVAQEALFKAEQAKKQAEALKLQAQNAKNTKLTVKDPEEDTKAPSPVKKEAQAFSQNQNPQNDEKKSWYSLNPFKKNEKALTEQQARANKPAQATLPEKNTEKASRNDVPVALLENDGAENIAKNTKEPSSDASTPWNPMTWFSKPASESTTANAPAETAPIQPQNANAVAAEVNLKTKAAIMETEKGSITFELYPDEAPATVANFAKLIDEGFYNRFNMKFHRVVPGFVIQTGDPTGTGAGGSKERIPLEAKNKLSHNTKGIVAMARGADPNSATSQFYITLTPQTSLDGKYAVFGKVIAGLDVLEKIEKGDMLYGIRLIDRDSVVRDPAPEKKNFFSSLL